MKSKLLAGIINQFEYYKLLGDKTFGQLPEDKLFWKYNNESNSIAVIVNHLNGNMLSRWTNFLATDGEKEWRDRDAEFEDTIKSKAEMLTKWEEGWNVLLNTLYNLTDDDLENMVYIRNQGHTVADAIYRQLAHYSYHIGQIVFVGKMCSSKWHTLSIAKGESKKFNDKKFSKPKTKEHYTEEFLRNENNNQKDSQ